MDDDKLTVSKNTDKTEEVDNAPTVVEDEKPKKVVAKSKKSDEEVVPQGIGGVYRSIGGGKRVKA